MLSRIILEPVKGIMSSYTAKNDPKKRLDVSQLSSSCFLTPDSNIALHKLNEAVRKQNGNLYITELYRTWSMQEQCHNDWLNKKRTDFIAPAGESFHQAGRAIDIDIKNINIYDGTDNWFQLFWDIAIPLGWMPIIGLPEPTSSEAWHFQFVGDEWRFLASIAPDKIVAQCAILDVGQWNPKEEPEKTTIRFIQAQCNRLILKTKDWKWLIPDGVYGIKTKNMVKELLNKEIYAMTDIAHELSNLKSIQTMT